MIISRKHHHQRIYLSFSFFFTMTSALLRRCHPLNNIKTSISYVTRLSSSSSSSKSINQHHKPSSTLKSGAYNHVEIDKKWQEYWDRHQIFVSKRRPGYPKKYILDMFPYPSGAGLHVGHPEGYTATDIMARYYRMRDYDVLHPMGWDSFGLPAEQHAISTGTHPAVTTNENIATFKRQLKSLGFSYDWTRELATTDDDYVKWTQWIFLQLFKKGLAMQSEVNVNWCPALGTVLANEEVINGLSERGNHPVLRMPLRQWLLRITAYADKLEAGLDEMNWPEGTLSAQRQWIGRSEGATIRFPLPSSPSSSASSLPSCIEVFTTRADTLLGVTYVVLAPEHPLVSHLSSSSQQMLVQEYIKLTASKSDLERTGTGKDRGKSGVFLGSYAIHPLTEEQVPIWIADYVLGGYGTGAVMAVPAHDERDYIFAQEHNLPIKRVISSSSAAAVQHDDDILPMIDDGILINSGEYDGLSSGQGKDAIIDKLMMSSYGEKKISYRLRDWVFSRQRYWGEPIPIYFPIEFYDDDGSIIPSSSSTTSSSPSSSSSSSVSSCKDKNPLTGSKHRICYEYPIAVSEDELPLKLPDMVNFQPGDDPQGCLARAGEWRYFQRAGQWYARETNTMPQWAGSCWYYLRFANNDHRCQSVLLSDEGKSWLPVDLYVGGQEHAVLHLLYARFWHKVLYDIGVVDHPEPFKKLVHQGMILGSDGEKMSKSRGNVINPDDVVKEYGADALRLYEMFMGPLEATKPWQTSQLAGVVRFRDRVIALVDMGVHDADFHTPSSGMSESLLREMHKTIKKVTHDIENMNYNTAISNLMVFTNNIYSSSSPSSSASSSSSTSSSTSSSSVSSSKSRPAVETLILLLSPFAPHVAEELWCRLGHNTSLAHHAWPGYDDLLCQDMMVTIAVQVNGKVRGEMMITRDMIQDDAMMMAKDIASVNKYVEGKTIKKIVYVPGRILNILV